MNETNNLKSEAMANFEDIIYNTTRGIYNLEDKLRIAIPFIFCYKMDTRLFAELMYTDNQNKFIEHLNSVYDCYDVDFTINFDDKLIRDCFKKTLLKIKEIYDKNGFYKAVYDKDNYALAVIDIVNRKFNKIEFKKYKCTDCGYENFKFNNGETRVGFCSNCEHPLWN